MRSGKRAVSQVVDGRESKQACAQRLTVDLERLALDAREAALLEELETANGETFTPSDALAALTGERPAIAGPGVKQDRDDKEVDQPLGRLERANASRCKGGQQGVEQGLGRLEGG